VFWYPPPWLLRLEAAAAHQVGLVGDHVGQFGAQPVHPALELVVEHVRHHGHATAHPLTGAGELGMVELGHAAVAVDHRLEHAHRRVETEAVALRDAVDEVMAGGSKLSHRGSFLVSRRLLARGLRGIVACVGPPSKARHEISFA
jgi:hypothetical protein